MEVVNECGNMLELVMSSGDMMTRRRAYWQEISTDNINKQIRNREELMLHIASNWPDYTISGAAITDRAIRLPSSSQVYILWY